MRGRLSKTVLLVSIALAAAWAAPSALAVPPANDMVAGAIVVPPGPYPVLSATVPDITDATLVGDPPTPSCQTNIPRSIWFKRPPATSSRFPVSGAAAQAPPSPVDHPVLAVYPPAGGDAGPFTEVPTTLRTD